MSKIAIHLDYPIIDGEQVTFRSPCASADANGLRIYTPTSYEDATETSTDYTMKDADGNTLNGKASLFAAGAYVTVALDTANAIAYLYNARSIYQAELDTKLNKTGDAADAKIGSSTASTSTYPIPAANDTFKVILGKIIKFFGDIKAAYTNVSISGKKITFTTAAGDTKEITTQDTTYGLASTTGDGLLKKLDSNTAHYMRGDGTWQTPPNTTYGLASTSANGLLRQLNGSTANYLRGDGTWQTPPNTNTWRGIQNNLTSTSATDSLSAAQGKILNDTKQKNLLIAQKLEQITVASHTTREYIFTPTALGISGNIVFYATMVHVAGAAYNNYYVNSDVYLNGTGVKVFLYNNTNASANIPVRVVVLYCKA